MTINLKNFFKERNSAMYLTLKCGCKIDVPWHQHSSPSPEFTYTYCQLHQNAERLLAFVNRSKSKKARQIIDDIADVEQWLVNDIIPSADENMIGLALSVLRGQYKDIEPLIDFLSERGIINVVSLSQSQATYQRFKQLFDTFISSIDEISRLKTAYNNSGDQQDLIYLLDAVGEMKDKWFVYTQLNPTDKD